MTGAWGRLDRLDRPDLAPLWNELARRLGEGTTPVTVRLRGLSPPEQRAVADLLGWDRLPGADTRVKVAKVAEALDVDAVTGLSGLVEALRGPIVDQRAARLSARREREALWTWLAGEAGGLAIARSSPPGGRPLDDWVAGVRAAGVPGGDTGGHRRRLAGALAVLAALPADGVALASLATDVLGDPHALDRGRRAAALVQDAVALALGRRRPADAEGARHLWEEVGVVPCPLSSTALALGLRPGGGGPLAEWLRQTAGVGEPAVVSLAQLRRWPLEPLGAGEVAYVVENPSLLTEAAARGWCGAPIVCSSGRPTVAVVTLLRQLGASGARLRQHADLDAAGLGITAWLSDRAGTTAWHMDRSDYLHATTAERPRLALTGHLPPTPWDPELRRTMADAGVAVHEEEVRSELLSAMSSGAPA